MNDSRQAATPARPSALAGTFAVVLAAAITPAGTIPPLAAQTPEAPAATATPVALEGPPPLAIRRSAGAITVDGRLDDDGWRDAAMTDSFWETSPGDNLPAKVRTVARFTYDERYLYIGVEAHDPEPTKIRAPFVDRDQVFGTDDNIAIFLDPRNDRRSAVELRVNPRGIQGDAVFNDANGNEDFSPDFFYDTAARIHDQGWTAEFRIPFSSLRYPEASPQDWGILVWRNWPREFRYAFHSAPLPRGSSCLVCRAHALAGFADLPRSKHLVVAPYVSARGESRRDPNAAAPRWDDDDPEAEAGLDVKWSPAPGTAIDLTINPDFSQIEADAPQIQANERFALFFPEKRPFFLEGVDLFDTPIQAVYTRTITAPRWGLRATGKTGSSAYSILVAEDGGGGLVVLPEPTASSLALQNFDSTVAVARLRRDFGGSFAGLLLTARDVQGGGHNAVFGPDLQWRRNESDTLRFQLLFADTEDPDRPDLGFRGLDGSGHSAFLSFTRTERRQEMAVRVRDVSDDFRADTGFVTAAGYRDLRLFYGRRFYPETSRWFRFVEPYGGRVTTRGRGGRGGGEDLGSNTFLGLQATGRKNLQVFTELFREEVAVGNRLLGQTSSFLFASIDPSRTWKRVTLEWTLGEAIDFDNAREADGGTIALTTILSPTPHLEVQLDARRRWIDVDGGRLFTASVERLRANWVFSTRQLMRLIVQNRETERDPGLYTFPVARRDGGLDVSLLYSFKLNWQTVLFLGLGDERLLTPQDDLEGVRRSVFFKLSYAIQR